MNIAGKREEPLRSQKYYGPIGKGIDNNLSKKYKKKPCLRFNKFDFKKLLKIPLLSLTIFN